MNFAEIKGGLQKELDAEKIIAQLKKSNFSLDNKKF